MLENLHAKGRVLKVKNDRVVFVGQNCRRVSKRPSISKTKLLPAWGFLHTTCTVLDDEGVRHQFDLLLCTDGFVKLNVFRILITTAELTALSITTRGLPENPKNK